MIYHKKTTNNNTYCDHDDDGDVFIEVYIYMRQKSNHPTCHLGYIIYESKIYPHDNNNNNNNNSQKS